MRVGALSVSAAVAVVVASAWACLPDLEIASAPTPAPACGDGVISPDAGEECDPGPDASAFATLCDQCRIECQLIADAGGALPFSDPVSRHCYFSFTNATEVDAGAICSENGAHVVRFVSESEVSLVAKNAGTTYWVGLDDPSAQTSSSWLPSQPTDEPGWSPECPGCFAHVEAGAADIPGATDAGRRCIRGGNGIPAPLWVQAPCRDALLTLCEREPVGTRTVPCAEGACFTVAATVTSKRYVLAPSPLDASAAVAACDAMDGGLVVFGSREEREQIGHELGTETALPAKADFWIGLSTSASGAWAWEGDAGGLRPLPWAVGQPTSAALPLRAYVLLAKGTVDSELARAQATADEEHYALCQIR